MSFRAFLIRSCLFVTVFAAAGCDRTVVKHNNTYTLTPGEPITVTVNAPKQQQTVKIEISGSDKPVDVVVFLTNEKNKPLVTKKGIKDESFEVTIPANESFSIVLSCPYETKVTMKANSL